MQQSIAPAQEVNMHEDGGITPPTGDQPSGEPQEGCESSASLMQFRATQSLARRRVAASVRLIYRTRDYRDMSPSHL